MSSAIDNDLLRRARLCLRNVPAYDEGRFNRFFRYTFEGSERVAVTNGHGVAFVRVVSAIYDELHSEIRGDRRTLEQAANWQFAKPIARAALCDWLERVPNDPCEELDGDRIEPVAPGVARGVVFDRRIVRAWLGPFMDLPFEQVRVSGNELDNRMLRVDGYGWTVIVMGRVDEPSDLPEPVAVCT